MIDKNNEESSEEDLNKEISDFQKEEGRESVADEEDVSEEEESPESSEKYSLLASALLEEGVLPSLNEEKIKEIKSFEDIAKAFKEEIRLNEYAGLTEDRKEYLKALESGVPEYEFKNYKSKELDYSKITTEDLESDEDLRLSLIKEDFTSKGYSEEKAEKLARRSIELGEDLEDASEALEIKKEKIKNEFQQKVKAYEEKLKEQEKASKEQIENLKKMAFDEKNVLIPGHKYNTKFAEKVYNTITKPVGHTEDGRGYNAIMKERMEDPVGFEYKISYLYNLTNGFKNFENIVKTATSNSVKKLDKLLNEQTYSKNEAGIGSSISDKKLNEALNILDKNL